MAGTPRKLGLVMKRRGPSARPRGLCCQNTLWRATLAFRLPIDDCRMSIEDLVITLSRRDRMLFNRQSPIANQQ
jgi:hypothetical protein